MAGFSAHAARDGDAGFFAALPPIHDFSAIADLSLYRPAPPDWLVVLTDIRNSTEAARSGRYKDVNLIGAASITAVLNVTPDIDVPYSFGGDGAVLLIPPGAREPVIEALLRTRALAAAEFDLELRVGVVPVAAIEAAGRRVLVGRLVLGKAAHLAMFAGGGVALADRLVKTDAAFRVDDREVEGGADLDGLSCRWEPCPSLRGRMVTLLVRVRDEDSPALEGEILAEIDRIMGGRAEEAAPVRRETLRFSWPPSGLAAEAKLLRGRPWRMLRRLWLWLEALLQAVSERTGLRVGSYDPGSYHGETARQSDYRKLADTLHMVLDCTAAEAGAIRAHLERLHAQGRIAYGLHEADQALMTCLVFSLAQQRHVHFVDGADGGYAMAAMAMKAQGAASKPLAPAAG